MDQLHHLLVGVRTLPDDLLDPATEKADVERHDHEQNVRIIEEKLRSFLSPALRKKLDTNKQEEAA